MGEIHECESCGFRGSEKAVRRHKRFCGKEGAMQASRSQSSLADMLALENEEDEVRPTKTTVVTAGREGSKQTSRAKQAKMAKGMSRSTKVFGSGFEQPPPPEVGTFDVYQDK